jgi:bifunctional ADP-heptose synthase (sugar kinase/adenylyltransferase)
MIESQPIQPQKKSKVLLIGDNCTDVYQYGTVDRISPEAPVPVFKFSHREFLPGMASNVLNNLKSLGLSVDAMMGEKSTKTRLIDLRSGQHIVRVDDDVDSSPVDLSTVNFETYDSVVVSDYNKGFVSYDTIELLTSKFQGPIFVDTKKPDLVKFLGCYVKVNEQEYNNRRSNTSNLIITLGSRGAQYKNKIYPAEQVEVVDVCGAGDTFLSALVAEFLNTKSIVEAIKFANRASAIAVQHKGVYTLTEEDIKKIK